LDSIIASALLVADFIDSIDPKPTHALQDERLIACRFRRKLQEFSLPAICAKNIVELPRSS
jgi:hypothetical protein